MDPLSALIGAGANIVGGLFGQSNNQANIQAQQQMNQQNLQQQLNFAQHGIQWKVDDAKAAGINPLAALGANTTSYQNLVAPESKDAMGPAVAAAGQDIGRAVQSMQSPEDKAAATLKTSLDLESQQLDNEIKRASLASSHAKLTQPGTPPGLRAAPWLEPGTIPDVSYSRTPGGGLAPHMSKEVQDRGYGAIEEAMWAMRNRVFPYEPPMQPDKGKFWSYNPLTGEWRQSLTIPEMWRQGRVDW